MEKTFNKKVRRTICVYNLLLLVVVLIFYFAVPELLSYPPNAINNDFEKSIDNGVQYWEQYGLVVSVGWILSNSLLIYQLRKVKKWPQIVNGTLNNEAEKKKIINTAFFAPIKLYVFHAFFPPLFIGLVLFVTGTTFILALKTAAAMLIMFLIIGLFIYTLSKSLFNDVLIYTKNSTKYMKTKIGNTYRARVLFQIGPLLVFAGTFIFMLASSIYLRDKSELAFARYIETLEDVQLQDNMSKEEIIDSLGKIKKLNAKDTHFIISKDKIIYQDTDEEITDFFLKYTYNVAENGHTYGYYATDIQGVYEFVNIDGERCAVGIMYKLSPLNSYTEIMIAFTILLIFILLLLHDFANDVSTSILAVSDSMKKLTGDESVDYNQKVPVISADEIGELTINFNKVLDVEKNYIDTIKQNQDILIENERLSSLGQLIGGIAHNLKTPIMSVSGYLVAIEQLADEYEQSIDNPNVTKEDYREITAEMKDWVRKSKDYMSYMTEVINAAKGQAVTLNADAVGSFTMQELVSRTEVLMKEELTKYNCNLDIKLNVPENTEIHGELSSIVQVVDNLISNAMQAYGGRSGQINFIVNDMNKQIEILIQDFAGGISETVKDKLFKEMVTTKGKNGTGLGLYMCYSTIRGKFNGDLRFESETGVGTTFIITLNKA